MRVDREFAQPRVLARDPVYYRERYISIPVNGKFLFNIVKSIKESKISRTKQTLEQYIYKAKHKTFKNNMNDVYLTRYKMIGYTCTVYFREQGLYYGGDFKGAPFTNTGPVFC